MKDFHSLFPNGTDSSLARNLTEEIWDEYKDQVDAEGVSFKTCIFSGVKNPDSSIGLYAGSHDSYYKFEKLFDKVIADYHGHSTSAQHVSDMDAEGLRDIDFSREEREMVVSTRIRVGRNLDGYPLGPGVTKAQRLEILDRVVKACRTFKGDLKGTFYPLDGMNY
jgi:hypothetical protein